MALAAPMPSAAAPGNPIGGLIVKGGCNGPCPKRTAAASDKGWDGKCQGRTTPACSSAAGKVVNPIPRVGTLVKSNTHDKRAATGKPVRAEKGTGSPKAQNF